MSTVNCNLVNCYSPTNSFKEAYMTGLAIGVFSIVVFETFKDPVSKLLSSIRAHLIPNKMDKLLQKILACPALKQLHDQVQSIPDGQGNADKWSITYDSTPNKENLLIIDSSLQEIILPKFNSEMQDISILVYGLSIALKDHERKELKVKKNEKFTNLKEINQYHFEALLHHKKVMKMVNEKMGWTTALEFSENLTTFEDYWENYKNIHNISSSKGEEEFLNIPIEHCIHLGYNDIFVNPCIK